MMQLGACYFTTSRTASLTRESVKQWPPDANANLANSMTSVPWVAYDMWSTVVMTLWKEEYNATRSHVQSWNPQWIRGIVSSLRTTTTIFPSYNIVLWRFSLQLQYPLRRSLRFTVIWRTWSLAKTASFRLATNSAKVRFCDITNFKKQKPSLWSRAQRLWYHLLGDGWILCLSADASDPFLTSQF